MNEIEHLWNDNIYIYYQWKSVLILSKIYASIYSWHVYKLSVILTTY